MILKLIGSVMVISASSLAGYLVARDCSRRPGQLRDLQIMIRMLENEIKFLSSFIPDAFERICRWMDSPVKVFFEAALEKIKSDPGINLSSAWETAVMENVDKTALNAEDRDIVLAFGKMLGNSDLEGQMKNIEFTLQQLSLQERKAEENKKKNEKLYKTLGFLGGLATVIVLI